MPIDYAKSSVFSWLSSPQPSTDVSTDDKCKTIMDVFARFYQVPTSIFTTLERFEMKNDPLKKAQNA